MTDDGLRCVMLRPNRDTPPAPAHVAGRVIVGTPARLAAAHVLDDRGERVPLFPKHCLPVAVPAHVTAVVDVDDLLAEWQAAAERAAARAAAHTT